MSMYKPKTNCIMLDKGGYHNNYSNTTDVDRATLYEQSGEVVTEAVYIGEVRAQNEEVVIETVDVVVPQVAKRVSCIDEVMMSISNVFDWLATNCCDILIIIMGVACVIGVYTITSAFYILACVSPEDWTFLDTGVKDGFYCAWMVICAVATSVVIVQPVYARFGDSVCSHTTTVIILALFVGLPFGLARHYNHLAYYRLCSNSLFKIEIHNNEVTYEGEYLYTISSSTSLTSLTISVGPLPDNTERTTVFSDDTNIVPYTGRLNLFGDDNGTAIISRSDKWYESRADFGDILFMEHPSQDNTAKVCLEMFDDILKITTVIPVLQRRMRVCKGCMEPCQTECIRSHWETRSTTTYSNGKSTTTYRTVKVCDEYRSYDECKNRCNYPACSGITL